MQRDEFLPLRVIRQELAAGHERDEGERRSTGPMRRAVTRRPAPRRASTADELIEQTGASEELLAELEDFGIVQPERRDGKLLYDETDLEIVRAAAELAPLRRRGAQPARLPHLRRPRGGAARAALRPGAALATARRGARRRSRASRASPRSARNLQHLLLVRDLRQLTGDEASAERRAAAADRGPRGRGVGAGLGPLPPAALVAARDPGRERPGRRRRAPQPLDHGARDPVAGARSGPTFAASARPRTSASSGSRRSPTRRSSASCAARCSRSTSSPSRRGPRSR